MKRGVVFSKRSLRIMGMLVCLLFLFLLRGPLHRLLQQIEQPFSQAGTRVAQWIGLLQDSRTLTVEDASLYKKQSFEIARLQALFQESSRERDSLRKTLGFLEQRPVLPLGADIISRTSANGLHRLVLNRGSRDGLVVGAPAIVEDGIYIGKITQVSDTQSILSTITDRDHATAVSLLNQTRTIGMIQGLNGRLSLLQFVPLEESIQMDDLVVTSGLEPSIPSGLLVGFINTVRPDPNGPFQEAIIEPMVDMQRYTSVIVLLSSPL